MENMKNKKIFILVITLLILVVGGTFAFFIGQIGPGANAPVDVTSDILDDLKFKVNKNINLTIDQFNFNQTAGNLSDTAIATASLKANSTNNKATYNYYVYFNIKNNEYVYTTADSKPEILLTVTNPNGVEVTAIEGLTHTTTGGISGFDITTAKGLFKVAVNHEISSASSTSYTNQDWTFKVSFINLDTNQLANQGKNLSAEVLIQKDLVPTTLADVCKSGENLAGCVKTYGDKNGTNMYIHNSTLANGANDNSYRYAGANPNNYICIGSTSKTCPIDNQYRIIGVFDDQVKVIKSDYATTAQLGTDGDYSNTYAGTGWSTSTYKGSQSPSNIGVYYWNNSSQNNNWNESILNKTNLNTNFLNKFDATTQNKMATTTWKVGGNTWGNIGTATAPNAFKNEITTPASSTTYNAKIGLMYVSDYGFAADPSAWTTTLNTYNGNSIPSKNWMYMGLNEWTISRGSGNALFSFLVYGPGSVINRPVRNGIGVRPVFYLTSSTNYASGSGSSADPIVIN